MWTLTVGSQRLRRARRQPRRRPDHQPASAVTKLVAG